MKINLEKVPNNSQVMIMSIHGDLDASNYRQLIDAGKRAVDQGAHFLLIDMAELDFMSSSGLIALHSIALLLRGEELADSENGWEAFRNLNRDRDGGVQERVKLLNPQSNIRHSLEITGLIEYFEIHTDRDSALASFS